MLDMNSFMYVDIFTHEIKNISVTPVFPFLQTTRSTTANDHPLAKGDWEHPSFVETFAAEDLV